MKEICTKEYCTGCQGCMAVCPVHAIRFIEDERGHIYPSINQDTCIDCGKCRRFCPSINPVPRNQTPLQSMACWTKNRDSRLISTSGGMSYELSRAFVQKGGFFVGVIWDSDEDNAKHVITDQLDKLSLFQGSKYSHSNVGNVYMEILNLLKEKKKVLFSGTPCQVAALKKVVGNNHSESLYTIGLVCHGVPSRKGLRERLTYIENKFHSKVVDYKSRVKTPDQINNSCQYTLLDGRKIQESVFEDVFFRFFVSNYGLRPNCFNCPYANCNRVEDITLADFWGYEPLQWKFRSYKKGTSMVLINSGKGQELFNHINSSLSIDVKTIDDARSCNQNLSAPQNKPKMYEEFWDRYLGGVSLEELGKVYFPVSNRNHYELMHYLKTQMKMILPSRILKIIKK